MKQNLSSCADHAASYGKYRAPSSISLLESKPPSGKEFPKGRSEAVAVFVFQKCFQCFIHFVGIFIDGKSLFALPAAQCYTASGMYGLQRRAAIATGYGCLHGARGTGPFAGKHP